MWSKLGICKFIHSGNIDWDPMGKALCEEEGSALGNVRASESRSTCMDEYPGPTKCSSSDSYY